MLLAVVIFLPPYSVMAQFGLVFTPHCFLHPAANCVRFHDWGWNMSVTPSEHIGITISEQAWRRVNLKHFYPPQTKFGVR